MKCKGVRYVLVFFFFFCLRLGNVAGQPVATQPDSVSAAPPAPLELRTVDLQKLDSLREDRDFRYYQDVRPDLSAWERFWRKVGEWLTWLLGGSGSKGPNLVWKYISYAFLLGVTVFVILKLLKVDFVHLFGRKSSGFAVPYEIYTENIHELDFQDLINQAEAQGDYRRAIRLYYLRLLKTLTDQELISWTPSKTNRTYVSELKSQGLRPSFAHITALFEYIWYGGSAVSAQRFAAVRQSFLEFDQSLQTKV